MHMFTNIPGVTSFQITIPKCPCQNKNIKILIDQAITLKKLNRFFRRGEPPQHLKQIDNQMKLKNHQAMHSENN